MDFRRKTAVVGGLVLLSCLVQASMIARAVVPAQDCVRYLFVAQGIERDGLTATLRMQPEQPLFPALVTLVHRGLSDLGWISPSEWALSLQLTAALPLVLSVISVYFLFCRLHGKNVAWLATCLYCLLGGIARLGADGLSDSTHLALFCCGLCCAVRYFAALPHASPWWLLACGGVTGLALTARFESIVLPAALLTSIVIDVIARRGQALAKAALAAWSLCLGLGLVLVPYLFWCDATTGSAALTRLMGRGGAAEGAPLNDSAAQAHANEVEPRWELPGAGRLMFGKKETSTTSRFRGYGPAAAKLVDELARTLHYWVGALALLGLWSARRRLGSPLDRFMQSLCGTLIVAGLYVAAHSGYLSTRHLLLVVVLALGWAGVGTFAAADWLSNIGRALQAAGTISTAVDRDDLCRERPLWRSASFRLTIDRWTAERLGGRSLQKRSFDALSRKNQAYRVAAASDPVGGGWATFIRAVFICAVLIVCGSDCLARLHGSRAAHLEAAHWLADHAQRSAAVLDSRGWTALYTGRKTYRYEAAQAAFSDPALGYVVVEQAELTANSRRSETMRLLLAHAEPVARFAAENEKHSVVIHRWCPERLQQLGVQSYAR